MQPKYDRVYESREVRRCRTRIRRRRRRNPSGGMECAFENPSTVFLPTLTYAPVRTRIGEKRSGAGGEMRLALLVPPDRLRSLSVFDAFSEHNKQTPPRNLFSYVRGHLPVYTSFSTFGVPFFFFPLLFGFLHFLTFDSGRVRKPAVPSFVRIVPIERETYLSFSSHIRTKSVKPEGKTFEISSTSIDIGRELTRPPVDESSRRILLFKKNRTGRTRRFESYRRRSWSR